MRRKHARSCRDGQLNKTERLRDREPGAVFVMLDADKLQEATDMIEIIGTALNQWDVGRSVKITGFEVEYAHFANKGDSKAVVVGVVDIDAKIPDFLLQTGKELCVYAVKDGITIESKTFYVKKREQPENYVYEDDKRNYIYELITDAERAIEDAIIAAEDADTSAGLAKFAAENAVKIADSANKAADSAIQAAKNANEAAVKAANTAKSLMVVGKVAGASIQLDDAIDQFLVGLRIFGKTTQDGTPTPDAPVDLVSVGDKGSIAVNVTGKTNAMSMIIATPNGLPGIPVASGGNYTDANGQQWICDEKDYARGVHIKRINVVDFENAVGYLSIYPVGSNIRRHDFRIADNPTFLPAANIGGMCNALVYSPLPTTRNDTDLTICSYINGGIYARYDKYATVGEFVAWAKEIGLKVQYVLATPIETPLSEEEIEAYASLHTYRDNTTVSNDAGAYMELEYVMDAKKYIDSLIGSGTSSAGIVNATVE